MTYIRGGYRSKAVLWGGYRSGVDMGYGWGGYRSGGGYGSGGWIWVREGGMDMGYSRGSPPQR